MYEYKVIPAPTKGKKARGVRSHEARFANALEISINDLAKEGWEYQRTDMLPSEERQGLKSTQTVYRSVMVFRRAVVTEAQLPPEPVITAPEPAPQPAPVVAPQETMEELLEDAASDPVTSESEPRS